MNHLMPPETAPSINKLLCTKDRKISTTCVTQETWPFTIVLKIVNVVVVIKIELISKLGE